MSLEDLTGSKYINSLVVTNPDGATDPKSQGDDHIRGIKNTVKNTFPSITGPVTATQDELNITDGLTRTTAQLNKTYFEGGTDVALADGGTGSSTASGARTNLGLKALAIKDTVASGDIDNAAVTGAKLASAAVSDAKINKITAYGSQSIGGGASWTIPAGLYTLVLTGNAGVAQLQIYTGSAWVGSSADAGGVLSDGSNVRFFHSGLATDSAFTVHYRKLA